MNTRPKRPGRPDYHEAIAYKNYQCEECSLRYTVGNHWYMKGKCEVCGGTLKAVYSINTLQACFCISYDFELKAEDDNGRS